MATRVSDLPVLTALTGGEVILVKQANNNLATLAANLFVSNEEAIAKMQPVYSELSGWDTMHDEDGRFLVDPQGLILQYKTDNQGG